MKFRHVHLDTAANGRAWLTTASARRFRWLGLLLSCRYGFDRRGENVAGPGDSIYPDFVRANLRVHAGDDDWTGYYLLAADAASDDFLRNLFATHCVADRGST